MDKKHKKTGYNVNGAQSKKLSFLSQILECVSELLYSHLNTRSKMEFNFYFSATSTTTSSVNLFLTRFIPKASFTLYYSFHLSFGSLTRVFITRVVDDEEVFSFENTFQGVVFIFCINKHSLEEIKTERENVIHFLVSIFSSEFPVKTQ